MSGREGAPPAGHQHRDYHKNSLQPQQPGVQRSLFPPGRRCVRPSHRGPGHRLRPWQGAPRPRFLLVEHKDNENEQCLAGHKAANVNQFVFVLQACLNQKCQDASVFRVDECRRTCNGHGVSHMTHIVLRTDGPQVMAAAGCVLLCFRCVTAI